MSTDLIPATASPFDALRRTDEQGNEYWSARDLMPHLGYDKWERFEGAIERARATIANTGQDPDVEASRRHEASRIDQEVFPASGKNLGGRPRVDYRLSRNAARLVAMNADPRKEPVAQTQEYFSRQTEFAEAVQHQAVQQAAQQFAVPQTMSEALRLAATAWEEKEQAQAALAVAAPKARAYDVVADPKDGFSVEQVAKMLTHDHDVRLSQPTLFKLLAEWRWIFRRHEKGRWVAYQTVVDRGWLRMVPAGYDHHLTGVRMTADDQVRVTGAGMAEILRRVTAPKQLALAVGGAA